MPGPNGRGSVTTTVAGVGRLDLHWLAVHGQRDDQLAFGEQLLRGANGEDDVGRRERLAVGPRQSRAQREGERPAVG